MQTYELFVTDDCTRKCSFCDIQKGKYKASHDDANAFVKYVKSHENVDSQFEISFFGGEPLICWTIVSYVIKQFITYSRCQFKLVTNADLISYININEIPYNMKIGISAYDWKNDFHKYKLIVEKFSNANVMIQLQNTFDENTIDDVYDFIDACNQINAAYKIAFSHSAKSWKNISIDLLVDKLSLFYSKQINDFYESNSFKAPNSIAFHLNNYVQSLFNENMTEVFCIGPHKKVFYKGEMIGSCIRMKNKVFMYPEKCKTCEYRKCCKKGCVAEYDGNKIDEKLCLLEKIPFIELSKFIKQHINDYRIKQILSYELKCGILYIK